MGEDGGGCGGSEGWCGCLPLKLQASYTHTPQYPPFTGQNPGFLKRGCYKPHPHVGVVILLFLPPPIMHVQPRTTGSQVNSKSPGFESQIYQKGA